MFAAIHAADSNAVSARAVLLDAAAALSPRVEDTASDTVILDIDGLERMFGSHADIAQKLAAWISEAGLHVYIAIASNPDTAMIAARGWAGITLIEAGREAARLSPLGIQVLRLDVETAETFSRWGISTLGALAKLPAKALVERLGQAGAHLHRLARGRASRPLVPRTAPLHFEETFEPDGAIDTLEPLAFILNRLLERLFQRLRIRGLAASEFHLNLQREHPPEPVIRAWRLPVAVQNARLVARLMMLGLEARPPGAAVCGIRVEAIPAKPRIVQNGLFTPLSPEPEKLELTLARIAAVVGAGNVGTPEIEDTHAPDRFRMRKFGCGLGSLLLHGAVTPPLPGRGIFRMFRPALEATVRAPEGIPVWMAFSGTHGPIATASGPWRGSGEWWNAAHWDREEWDVELADGKTIRIFKDGATGRWYAEGIYD